jgi:hypothetical protein
MKTLKNLFLFSALAVPGLPGVALADTATFFPKARMIAKLRVTGRRWELRWATVIVLLAILQVLLSAMLNR